MLLLSVALWKGSWIPRSVNCQTQPAISWCWSEHIWTSKPPRPQPVVRSICKTDEQVQVKKNEPSKCGSKLKQTNTQKVFIKSQYIKNQTTTHFKSIPWNVNWCIYYIFNTSWWLNQPIWKICSSNWKSSPKFGVKIKHIWNHHLENVLWELGTLKNQQNLNSLVKSITSPSEVPTWRITLKSQLVYYAISLTHHSHPNQPILPRPSRNHSRHLRSSQTGSFVQCSASSRSHGIQLLWSDLLTSHNPIGSMYGIF